MDSTSYSVSEFVDYLNQTLEVAYPYVTIEGELSNFRVSKNRWVYFDLKDAGATLRCFGTVYMLPGPLEDGMVVRVSGNPRLHPLYNFSLTTQSIVPVGEGMIRKAADLLAAKLDKEGLFDPERKRPLPYPPRHIALITASGSAAYADFMKITNARWQGLLIDHYDSLVQGEQAPAQLVAAITAANAAPEPADVLVLTRGGGSAEDLAAFSSETVVRAVAASRIPTLVAIGHEIDTSLAELAADRRASTPSNAAELLLPDRREVFERLAASRLDLQTGLLGHAARRLKKVREQKKTLDIQLLGIFERSAHRLDSARLLLEAYNPQTALTRGYALVRSGQGIVRSVKSVQTGDTLHITLSDGTVTADVSSIKEHK